MKTLGNRVGRLLGYIKVYKNWIRILLYRYNILPQPMTARLRNGEKFYLRDHREQESDLFCINESHLYGIHDRLLPYLKTAKVVVDVGAHIGTFSIWASRRSEAKIYAMEPVIETRMSLLNNIVLNKYDLRNFDVVPYALSDTTGEKELTVPIDQGYSTFYPHLLFKHRGKGELLSKNYKVNVPTLSLKDFFEKYKIDFCDVMKIDCEGEEYPIIYSSSEETLKKVGVFSIEAHIDTGGSREELKKFLRDKGFRVESLTGEFGVILAVNKHLYTEIC